MRDLNGPDIPEILSSEKARMRALSLNIIRSIVEEHHGNVEEDEAADYINIDVPDGEAAACAQQIGEQIGWVCHHVYAHVDALFRGELLLQFYDN